MSVPTSNTVLKTGNHMRLEYKSHNVNTPTSLVILKADRISSRKVIIHEHLQFSFPYSKLYFTISAQEQL